MNRRANFSNTVLKRMGVTTRYYDPRIGAGIADLIAPNTKAIFTESPGSLTFEIQDLPSIAEAAHAAGAKVLIDNSWATPLYHRPLELGADIVIHAGTKMFVGHSDAMSGTISANEATFPAVADTVRAMGVCAAPDDAYLIARGLRTLSVRMAEHTAPGPRHRQLAARPGRRPCRSAPGPAPTIRIMPCSPATSPAPAACSAFVLEPAPRAAIAALVDNMQLFGMGYSWGGYESLILSVTPGRIRTAVPWPEQGNLFRVHIGFEDVDDLKADLAEAISRYRAAAG